MAQSSTHRLRGPQHLTTSRGAALYIGALLGPGLLLLPGLAAAEAGPASILAWLALLGLSGLFATVFSAFGRRWPSAGGVMGYVAAGLGKRAGLVAGWSFLAAVVGGAPVVCLIGASYVTGLTGGGYLARAAAAAVLLLTVLALAAGGLRASTGAQLILVGLLIGVVAVAVAGSAASARAANWTPFAPHGWSSIGHAATTLMLSFVGWEAVAPLTTRFANPSRQLPRVVGHRPRGHDRALPEPGHRHDQRARAGSRHHRPAGRPAPPRHRPGRPGRRGGGGGRADAGHDQRLHHRRRDHGPAACRPAAAAGRDLRPAPRFLAVIAASGLLLITLYGFRLVSTDIAGRGADGSLPVRLPCQHGRRRRGPCPARPARPPSPPRWRSWSCWPTAAGH